MKNLKISLYLLIFILSPLLVSIVRAQSSGCGSASGGVPYDQSKCGPGGITYTTITPAVNAGTGGTAVSACGATIASSTNYYLTGNIGSDATAVCITLPGVSNVHIDLQGNTITGVIYANNAGDQQGIRIFNGTITCSTSGSEGVVGPPATMACLTVNNNGGYSPTVVSIFHNLTITNSYSSGTDNVNSTGNPFAVVGDYGSNTWSGSGPQVILEYDNITLSGNNYNSAREGGMYILGIGPFQANNNIYNLSAGAGTAQGVIFYGSGGGSQILNNECLASLTAYAGAETSTGRCFFFDFSSGTSSSKLEIGNNYITANDNRCFRFRDSQYPYIHDNYCGGIRLGGASSGTLGAMHLGDPDPFNGHVTAITCGTPATSSNACQMTVNSPFTGHPGDLMTLSGFTPSSLNENVTIGTGNNLTTIFYASNTTSNNGVTASGFGDMEYSNTMNGTIQNNTFQFACVSNEAGIAMADRTTTGNLIQNNTIATDGNCANSSFTGAVYVRYLNIAQDSFIIQNTTYSQQVGPNSNATLFKVSNGPSGANQQYAQYCNTLGSNGITDGDAGWKSFSTCSGGAPNPPGALAVYVSSAKVPYTTSLTWIASTTPSVTYNVYRTMSVNNTYTCPSNGIWPKVATGLASTSYTDSSLGIGMWCYQITAVSGGFESTPDPSVALPVPPQGGVF